MNEHEENGELPVLSAKADDLRVNLAIGTLTFFISVFLLFLLNYAVYSFYHPDIKAILDKVVPLSIYPASWFAPEPVERLQYQLSLIFTPFIIFSVFTLVNKKKNIFYNNQRLCLATSITGLAIFIFFITDLFTESLLHIHNETNAWFFNNNLIGIFNPFVSVIFYLLLTYLFYLYVKTKETTLKKTITIIMVYSIVAIVILDVVLYNVFNLANVSNDVSGETNAVFYAITQVYAGKSLLVDLNCQYGLYAWFLCPIFKLIGLSAYKIGMVMGILNGMSYLLIYLGLKKLIKQDLLSLLTFLCLIFWQYWQTRIPFGESARFYYQYCPIRLFFPSLVLFLLVLYQQSAQNHKRILLPLLALSVSFAILWNSDTGIVVYGAALIALLVAAYNSLSLKDAIKQGLTYIAWMSAALAFVLILFFVSTKIHSGSWPDLKKITDYQSIFYISGYFMLPMAAIHFWNLPVIVYLVTCIYCVYNLKKTGQEDLSVLVFLFILGAGLFAYFQGRSFDSTIDVVMYPAIIILGIFCNKLIPRIRSYKNMFHESAIFFLIPFIFIADGACSMICSTPSIHEFAWNNATSINVESEKKLTLRLDFIKNNIPAKDTVLIVAKNYEGFYYALGQYYNPLNTPGSTEIFFKSELDALLCCIRTTKYPIIYYARYYWPHADTIIATLAKYSTIQKVLPEDYTLILLKPGKIPVPDRLFSDANTLYINCLGEFSKYVNQTSQISLPENFTIEFYGRLDTENLAKDNIMFCTIAQNNPFSGFLMKQDGDDLTQYKFVYGNGSEWCNGVVCKLSCTKEHHIVIKVQKNIVAVFNNDLPSGEVNTNSMIKNNNGIFYINNGFAGVINEIKVSNQ